MKVAVVVFPGSNCDRDAVHGVQLAGATADLKDMPGCRGKEAFNEMISVTRLELHSGVL